MDTIVKPIELFLEGYHPVTQAFFGGLFTWIVTAMGAGLVFFFKGTSRKLLDTTLGFAGGVMIAASFWSLLSPSISYVEDQNNLKATQIAALADFKGISEIEAQELIVKNDNKTEQDQALIRFEETYCTDKEKEEKLERVFNNKDISMTPNWQPPAIGFLLGALFLFYLDKKIPHLHLFSKKEEAEGVSKEKLKEWKKTILLVFAIALHNIPEGLAVGVAFAAASAGIPGFETGEAIALAIGMGLQNAPEGFAVSMPLRRQGVSKFKSWQWGQLSAIVEPIFAVIGAAIVMAILPILPYALAFAAGAMIFIVVEEVIPSSQKAGHTDIATMGLIGGFIVMMILDVALG